MTPAGITRVNLSFICPTLGHGPSQELPVLCMRADGLTAPPTVQRVARHWGPMPTLLGLPTAPLGRGARPISTRCDSWLTAAVTVNFSCLPPAPPEARGVRLATDAHDGRSSTPRPDRNYTERERKPTSLLV
ncbi:hypothetical protein SKAU_G00390110 [Synaphobranchus kaupii]|uniref:Uncharacterized protein n=1 Tax=Synaphobranchus kaupii TaxID=118154 RepID=A0A9Q1IDH9_SYNKA|nr:hypothetical protein SKAU_G00390110 [Synaphobranchus kaupii]